MDPSLFLAVYGAGLSTVLAFPTLQRWRADRPRLRVELSYEGIYEKLPEYQQLQDVTDDLEGTQLIATVIVDVWNDGRADATVREVALALAVGNGEIKSLLPLSEPGEVIAIPALKMQRFSKPMFSVQPDAPIDKPVRAYAVDGHNRIVWSRPQRLYRHLVDNRWLPPEEIPADQLKRQDLPPALPEASWKLWKPRHLRRGTDVD